MSYKSHNHKGFAGIWWAMVLLLGLGSTAPALAVNSGCAELADARDAGLPGPPAGQPKVTCAAFFPFAITTDGNEASRLEVRIQGSVTAAALGNTFAIVGVSVQGVNIPQTGAFIDLFDDGSHGDRVAGDGIWSRGDVRINAVPIPPIFFYEYDRLKYTDGNGSDIISITALGSNGQYGPARLGRLDPVYAESATSIGDGFLTTDNVVFMVNSALHAELRWLLRARSPVADIQSVVRAFYAKFPDAFDFILLMPGAHVPGGLGGTKLAGSNSVTGIGRPVFDLSADWGSAGRLQSVLPLNLSESGPVLHEISHRWGIAVGQDLGLQQCAPTHIGVAGVGCGPLGGFDASSLVNNGDGTWTVSNTCFSQGGAPADTTSMNPLNLYLAGLIPASQVPPFPVPVNVDCFSMRQDFGAGTVTFAADGMVTRTIDEIINLHGPRVPDYNAAQRGFTMAWVVPINRLPTPTETGWFQYRAEYIARNVPGDQPFRKTFWEATGGRATLTTNLALPIFKDSFEDP